MRSPGLVALVPARIALPRQAAGLAYTEHGEVADHGRNIHNMVQYRSADGEVFGTVYIDLPGLAHSGLSAIGTDIGIRLVSQSAEEVGEARVAAAGGSDGVAIRRDYTGYMDGLATSAAFVKAGRWLVKFRVSGPMARRAEVAAAMDALLAGIRFGAGARPHSAAPIRVRDCVPGTGSRPATLLSDPPGAEIAAHAFLGTFDAAGTMAAENGVPTPLGSRIPGELCLSTRVSIGRWQMPILRAEPGPPLSIHGRTLLLAVTNDSSGAFEIVHAENLGRYHLLRHRMGESILLGGFDAVPSDDQIADIILGRDAEGGRFRAAVVLTADGQVQMHLPQPAANETPPN